MGFAGQIFAARVAVGLATPSGKALGDAGKVIAGGVGKIYSNMNSQRVQAAKKATSGARKSYTDAVALAKTSEKELSKTMTSGLAESIDLMNAQGSKIGKSMAAMPKSAFKETAELLKDTDVGNKLFDASVMNSALKPMERMQNLTRNFAKLTEVERKAVMKKGRLAVRNAEDELKSREKLFKSNEKSEEQLKKMTPYMRNKYNKQRKQDRARLEAQELTVKKLREEEQELLDLKKVVESDLDPALEKHNKVVKKVESAHDKLEDTLEEEEQTIKDVATESKKMGEIVENTANEAINGFSNAIQTSVTNLTAFFYKLNQSTQELIEFERELYNANSVWNESKDVLFEAGEQVTQFGQKFGLEMQNGATGLYQLASAGLTADESMEVLGNTLKLSMAVQGDHNTIAKLTTQTIRGFDMEMTDSAEVTDKFAHAIQKSLIEYEDLSSAVKFALPFFTSTGQSIDQLLGSLQVLTNRALEAGIAGRGLRQALAEFAEGAEDNDRAFRKMGISILNSEGDMRQLNEIAADFAKVVGEDTVSNTELLTTLIDDLNVRGATAFVHLVQASDEFTAAVESTRNAGGELDEMVKIQNESMSAQIQILKNNTEAIFMMQDATYEGTGYLNGFHEAVVQSIQSLQGLLVVERDNGYELTELGLNIRDIATNGVLVLTKLIQEFIPVIVEFSKETKFGTSLLKLYAMPLQIVADILTMLGPTATKYILTLHMMNKVLPITTLLTSYMKMSAISAAGAVAVETGAIGAKNAALVNLNRTMTITRGLMLATGIGALLVGGGYLLNKYMEANEPEGRYGGGPVKPMASGGRTSGGAPYMVGERGPELFVPSTSGQILNNGWRQSGPKKCNDWY